MIGWLYRMIVGRFDSCRHSWETIDVYDRHPRGHLDVFIGECRVLRCKSCGDITYRNT